MIGLVLLASWQILAGPERADTLWHLPTGSYLVLALVLLIGSMSCLSATVQSDSWTATAYEIFGELMVLGPLVVYFVSIVGTARYPDTDIVTMLLGGLILGLCGRILAIARDTYGVVREGLAPPVGDLDLQTAESVESVAAVVVEQHGSSIKEEVGQLLERTRPRHSLEEDG